MAKPPSVFAQVEQAIGDAETGITRQQLLIVCLIRVERPTERACAQLVRQEAHLTKLNAWRERIL